MIMFFITIFNIITFLTAVKSKSILKRKGQIYKDKYWLKLKYISTNGKPNDWYRVWTTLSLLILQLSLSLSLPRPLSS